jgi:hypothetical protein
MEKRRKHYTAFAEVKLQPMVFYRWQKEFFEHGAAAFDSAFSPC